MIDSRTLSVSPSSSTETSKRRIRRSVVLFAIGVLCAVVLGAMPSVAAAGCVSTTLSQRLVDEQNSDTCGYGADVAIWGNTAIIGASFGNLSNISDAGNAYIYTRTTSSASWQLEATLPNPSASSQDQFGNAVAIEGNTAVVGSNAQVHIYVRSGTTWTLQQALAPGGAFGNDVGISGNTVVVGAKTYSSGSFTGSGRTYVYTRSGTTWSLQATLNPLIIVSGGNFGNSVSIWGDTVSIAQLNTLPGGGGSGLSRVYIYRRSGSVWSVEDELEPVSSYPGATRYAVDLFGFSMSLVGDTVVIGAPGDQLPTDPANTSYGSAFVFARSGSNWSQTAKLQPPDPRQGERLGRSVAQNGLGFAAVGGIGSLTKDRAIAFRTVSGAWVQQHALLRGGEPVLHELYGNSIALSGGSSGGTVLVAGFTGDNTTIGSVFSFATDSVGWMQTQILQEPLNTNDNFGNAVATATDYAVVGIVQDGRVGSNAGAAQVFYRNGGVWQRIATLTGPGESSAFGAAVAISADATTIAIGAPFDGSNNTGGVWVFTRLGSGLSATWPLEQIIRASDAQANDHFGASVSLRSSTILIGAPEDDNAEGTDAGAAYIFTRSGGVWGDQRKLAPAALEAGDKFGVSVAIMSSSRVVVGAFGDNTGALTNSGAAYLFDFQGTFGNAFWNVTQVFIPADVGAGDNFGYSLAVAGVNTVVVGSPLDDNTSGADAGAVYVFKASGIGASPSGWSQQTKLTRVGQNDDDRFGSAVAMSGSVLLVGAPFSDEEFNGFTDDGSVWLYLQVNNVWTLQYGFGLSDKRSGDRWGTSLAISSDAMLVGSPVRDTEAGVDAGRAVAYQYSVNPPPITSEPQPVVACRSTSSVSFTVGSAFPTFYTHRWYRNNMLVSDVPGHISGATTQTITIANPAAADAGTYVAEVSNPCGTSTSAGALLTICPADYNCSGAVTVQDIFDFLAGYFNGDAAADFNGSGVPVTVQDIFDFLAAYFAGCGG